MLHEAIFRIEFESSRVVVGRKEYHAIFYLENEHPYCPGCRAITVMIGGLVSVYFCEKHDLSNPNVMKLCSRRPLAIEIVGTSEPTWCRLCESNYSFNYICEDCAGKIYRAVSIGYEFFRDRIKRFI